MRERRDREKKEERQWPEMMKMVIVVWFDKITLKVNHVSDT